MPRDGGRSRGVCRSGRGQNAGAHPSRCPSLRDSAPAALTVWKLGETALDVPLRPRACGDAHAADAFIHADLARHSSRSGAAGEGVEELVAVQACVPWVPRRGVRWADLDACRALPATRHADRLAHRPFGVSQDGGQANGGAERHVLPRLGRQDPQTGPSDPRGAPLTQHLRQLVHRGSSCALRSTHGARASGCCIFNYRTQTIQIVEFAAGVALSQRSSRSMV